MQKFIFLEGLDGSGKSTQISLLQEHFNKKNIKFKYLHFPRLESGIYGDLVAMFLRGEFGALNEVHPYLATLLYAGDRMDAKSLINEWMNDDYLVLVDRYVYSNIAYQCAKLELDEEKTKLRDWIINLEFNYNKIPKPEIGIFLDVPFQFTKNKLTNIRDGNDRNYLHGKQDIHEQSLDFQSTVRLEYLKLVTYDPAFHLVECSDNGETILPADAISKKIIDVFEQYL